jgi:hypothetical protein
MATHLGRACAWTQLQEILLDPSFVRALSDFSNEALADAYDWAAECLAQMSEGPRRRLLSQLCAAARKQRRFMRRMADISRIESFLDTQDSPNLFLVGAPGTGKSALAAQVWLRNLDRCLFEVVPAAGTLLDALVNIFRKLPFLEEQELATDSKWPLAVLSSELLDRVFLELLDRVARNGRPLCIIIDEVDAIRDQISNLRLGLPPNLKMIWVGRQTLAPHCSVGSQLVVSLNEMAQSETLYFLRQRLGSRFPEHLLERIAVRSGGNLLYAELIARQLERGELIVHQLASLPQSLSEVYEAKTQALETAHPGIRERLALLVGAIAIPQNRMTTVGLQEIRVQFDGEELDSIKESGLFVVMSDEKGINIGVAHESVLDFLQQRYGIIKPAKGQPHWRRHRHEQGD